MENRNLNLMAVAGPLGHPPMELPQIWNALPRFHASVGHDADAGFGPSSEHYRATTDQQRAA